LDYTENPGAFLGLGGSLSSGWRTALFSAGAALGIAAILGCALFVPRFGAARILALTLIGSGGIGNVIDRVWYGGYVRDFLNIGLGPVRSGIFNVADVLLVAGCVLFFAARGEGLQSRHGSWSGGPGNGVAGTP
jgi:signal peptidase II